MVVVKYAVTHLNQLKNLFFISKTAILPKHWDSSNHVDATNHVAATKY